MSRDWRPVEQYAADKAFKEEKGTALRDARFTMHVNGEEFPVTYEKARGTYPELSFLMNGFDSLYKKYEDDKAVCKVFDKWEKALEQAEARFDETNAFPDSHGPYAFERLDEEELIKQSVEAVTDAWFYGYLDSTFYYSEENNGVMMTFIKGKIDEVKAKGKDIER